MADDDGGRGGRGKLLAGIGVLIAAVVAVFAFTNTADAVPCARPTGKTQARASLELAQKVAARDTMAIVRVCLATKDPAVRIGSYHGLLTYDSLAARLIQVDRSKQGMKVANTNKSGVIDFAAAFPGGMDDSVALTFRLALAKPGKLPPLRLHMYELNALSGTVLTSSVRVTGYPSSLVTTPGPLRRDTSASAATPAKTDSTPKKVASTTGKTPSAKTDSIKRPSSTGGNAAVDGVHLESVTPSSATPGEPITVVIKGTGFTPTGNTVRFGRIEVTNISSTAGGTLIRVSVPTEFPATGEVPPKQIGPGDFPISVRNSRGSSNELAFVLRS
jgi:hypothetical protein